VILIDTSAWIEFLRDTGSPICQRVDDLLATEIATSGVVRMEVLAGARDEQHLQQLRRLFARASTLPTEPVDYDAAAALYRACRQRGHTVRKLIDCLIAAVAIRGDLPVLHIDVDFDILAQHKTLQVDVV
jgi:predicted nucleic acid-binding protein